MIDLIGGVCGRCASKPTPLDALCLEHWNAGLRRLGAFCKRLNASQIEVEDAFVRLIAAKRIAGR